MNAERIIAEIEWLEKLFRLPDERSLLILDCRAGKRAHACAEHRVEVVSGTRLIFPGYRT
jgi:hypothetical protein